MRPHAQILATTMSLLAWAAADDGYGQTAGGPVRSSDVCRQDPSFGAEMPGAASRLERVRCLLERGERAMGILLLQQMVAQMPANREAATLLDEQMAGAVTLPVPPDEMKFNAWVASEVGHDSNINRASSAKVIQIPLLNYRSLSLPDLMVERSSSFVGAQAGASLRMPFGASWQGALLAQGSVRANVAEASYLPHNYALVARLERKLESVTLGVGVSTAQQWVAKYRMLGRLSYHLHAAWRPRQDVVVSGTAEWADNVYPMFESLQTRESSQEIRVAHGPSGLHVSAYRGEEAAPGTIKDLDRSFSGIGIGWRFPVAANSLFAIDITSGNSRYKQFSRLFAAQRTDRQADITLALHKRFGDTWTVSPRIVLERNDSSLALNGYRRAQYFVDVRRDF